MSYGISVTGPNGSVIVSPATLAALYAGEVSCSITSGTQVFTFPSIPAGKLYAIQLATTSKYGGGTHTWAIDSVNGYARITFTHQVLPYQASATTTLRLFASGTFEPDYGINATNDAGERIISTIFPACQFIQKLTLSPTLSKIDSYFGLNDYWLQTTATASQSGLVFWSLPSSTDTGIWWAGATTASAGSKVTMWANLPSGVAPAQLPEAFLFKQGPITASTAWGIRVFNGAGAVMFDGGVESLKIEARITDAAYNSLTEGSYALPTGYTPAVYMPAYAAERKRGTGGPQGSPGTSHYKGMMRRNGSTLYTKSVLLYAERDSWDDRRDEREYEWGMKTGLFVPVINANRYGGVSI